MKIIDCTTYHSEDLMMDVRFNILNDYVDKFVVTESKFSHSGNQKPLKFNINNFPKFKDKIKYLVVEDLPQNTGFFKKNWHSAHIRDQFQRNSLERGYKHFNDDDLIMISDIDEIPNPKKISEFEIKNKYACFIQKNFQAKLNNLNITESNWLGTKICQKKFLKSPQWLRNIKTKKRKIWAFYKQKEPQIILDGGWHFSFLKESKLIKQKIESFAHQEFNQSNLTNLENIKKRIKSGVDIFERPFQYKKIDLNNDFPEYILNNKSKFKDWIL